MTFFITRSLFQAPNNFITTISTILLIVMVGAQVALSAPIRDHTSSDSGIQDLIGQVSNGLEILIGLGSHLNGTILDIEDFQNINVSLRTVCNMYELYAHFTTLQILSTVQPQHALHTDYSSNLFVSWRLTQVACLWAVNSGSSLPTDCTLISIANTCYSFNHQRLILLDRPEILGAAERRIPISKNQWISRNELPQHVAEYIKNNL